MTPYGSEQQVPMFALTEVTQHYVQPEIEGDQSFANASAWPWRTLLFDTEIVACKNCIRINLWTLQMAI